MLARYSLQLKDVCSIERLLRLAIGVPFVVIAMMASCRDSTSPPAPQSISFDSPSLALLVDESAVARAIVTLSDGSTGSDFVITYSSSSEAVVTIDRIGRITAVGPGTAIITASVGTLQARLPVTVTWAPITQLVFPLLRDSILLDDTLTVRAVPLNSQKKVAPNAAVAYVSSNPSVATVDANGRVKTLTKGTTSIIAREGLLSDTMEIKVISQFIYLAAGEFHACGLTGKHELYCWGLDDDGELGSGTTWTPCQIGSSCSAVPVRVAGGGFVSVTAGTNHTCALHSSGAAYCWGATLNGVLGFTVPGNRTSTPLPVSGGLRFTYLATGRLHTCGITTGGDTYCWGWDHWGQLGLGATAPDRCDFVYANAPCSNTPRKVAGGQTFSKVWASEKQTCGQTPGETIYCWGLDVGGSEQRDCQFETVARCTRTPLLQASGERFPLFGMGSLLRCGQRLDGIIYCWGYDFNNFGNGNNFPVSSSTPVPTASGHHFIFGTMLVGRAHVCGIDSIFVLCWGNGESGQVGGAVGTNRNFGGAAAPGNFFEKIFSSPVADFSCGLGTDGRAYCWGNGRQGQLGNGSFAAQAFPVQVKLFR